MCKELLPKIYWSAQTRFLWIVIFWNIYVMIHKIFRLFEYGGFPPESNYLFLGDYVDRGKQSLESICLLLAYKVDLPSGIHWYASPIDSVRG